MNEPEEKEIPDCVICDRPDCRICDKGGIIEDSPALGMAVISIMAMFVLYVDQWGQAFYLLGC
jgi:hypothetical protein